MYDSFSFPHLRACRHSERFQNALKEQGAGAMGGL